MSENNPMNVREGQRWTHRPPNGGRRTDYVVQRVWKHRALFFADHGNFTEKATVILARMTPGEWTCLDAGAISDRGPWPSASCCGEPRVTRLVDRCYDCAEACTVCGQPAERPVHPGCERYA